MLAQKFPANNIEVQINQPFDTRAVTNNHTGMTEYLYEGLLTYDTNEDKYFSIKTIVRDSNGDITDVVWEERPSIDAVTAATTDISFLKSTVSGHTKDIENINKNFEKLEERVDEIELVTSESLNVLKEDVDENNKAISLLREEVKNSTKLTYLELVELRDNAQLTPGTKYQIVDYVTTTNQENTQSAGHQFDIIVEALTENTLSEDVKVCLHEGDTYFANSDFNAWEVKYCLDNDAERFAWADTTNGKGVIFYMKDEFNNEVWYDFKNIQFLRTSQWFNDHPAEIYSTTSGITQDTYFYTFSKIQNGEVVDDSLSKYTVNNKLGKGNNYQLQLDNTILIGNGPFNNTIGNGHKNNTLGRGFCYNNIGCNFRDNIIALRC